MPTLSNLSINQPGQEQLAHYTNAQQAAAPQNRPPELSIQSWAAAPVAGGDVQQPRPIPPQTWNPNVGIRFNGGVPPSGQAQGQQVQQQQQQQQPQQQTWNPNAGIRFG